uniref:Uncharacterized protein n=1 Tax=Siphoviridae sp. ctdau33 TaxID=2827902 RepID=A0A8S5S6B2_9CAUD|nr:MAG TPA: hypothetical protein [Siphoviridae sp. ctdau33]
MFYSIVLKSPPYTCNFFTKLYNRCQKGGVFLRN